jgi:hypothetical protein
VRRVKVVVSQIQALEMLKSEEATWFVKSTQDEFIGQVKTNNTSLMAGYTFPRTAINTLIPLNKFVGRSGIEWKVVLQLQQQGLLIAETLARHAKDTNAN